MTAPSHNDDDDPFTELTDAEFDRVDAVGAAANGTEWLIAKAAAERSGLMSPDFVRDLISKADEQEETAVTDPAPDDVAKADLDVTEPLAADAETADGNVETPGSPAWEAVDAATAQKWASILGRAKVALTLLSDREAMEASVGDVEGAENAWNLVDACEAVDYAISVLAPYALGEQLDVELAEPSPLDAVGKALGGFDPAALTAVEVLAPLRKAGRVLSAANESSLRTARDAIDGVLASLPQAPVAEDVTKTEETTVATAPPLVIDVKLDEDAFREALAKATGTPVRAETPMFDALVKSAPSLTQRDVIATLAGGGSTVDVSKAAGDPQLAVFDADGKLIGTIDPAKLSPIATSPAAADKPDEPAAETPAQEAPTGEPADAPAAAAPAAEDAAMIPGTATVQSPPAHDETVAKAVATGLAEALAPLAEQLGLVAQLAKEHEDLKETVRKMGEQPDNRRSPVLNGAPGVPGVVTRDGAPADGQFAALEKAVAEATTDTERVEAQSHLAYAKVLDRFNR